jgi:hypothetical protein
MCLLALHPPIASAQECDDDCAYSPPPPPPPTTAYSYDYTPYDYGNNNDNSSYDYGGSNTNYGYNGSSSGGTNGYSYENPYIPTVTYDYGSYESTYNVETTSNTSAYTSTPTDNGTNYSDPSSFWTTDENSVVLAQFVITRPVVAPPNAVPGVNYDGGFSGGTVDNRSTLERGYDALVSGVTNVLEVTTYALYSDSVVLARNMAQQTGAVRELGQHAHHIVAANDQRAAESRLILENAGMGINDANNGAFMSAPAHTTNYHAAVTDTLRGATTYEEVATRLSVLRAAISTDFFIR